MKKMKLLILEAQLSVTGKQICTKLKIHVEPKQDLRNLLTLGQP